MEENIIKVMLRDHSFLSFNFISVIIFYFIYLFICFFCYYYFYAKRLTLTILINITLPVLRHICFGFRASRTEEAKGFASFPSRKTRLRSQDTRSIAFTQCK